MEKLRGEVSLSAQASRLESARPRTSPNLLDFPQFVKTNHIAVTIIFVSHMAGFYLFCMKTDDEIVAAMLKTRPKMVGFRLDDDHRLILFRRAHLGRAHV